MKKLLNIEVTDEEFDRLICEQPKGKELKVVDGKVVAVEIVITEKELNQKRIIELTQNLYLTDYIANKLIEAETEEERQELRLQYATQLANRKQWRKEISDLQDKLKTLEQEA